MNTPTLTLECPELTAAILKLVEALQSGAAPSIGHGVPVQPDTPPVVATVPTVPVTAPVQQVQPQNYSVPTVPATPAPVSVPTASPTYTLDQLAPAAARMVEAGKQDQIVALLARFGVQALTQLPAEQYGAFATELRQMGAQI